jgi:hypothetical protein
MTVWEFGAPPAKLSAAPRGRTDERTTLDFEAGTRGATSLPFCGSLPLQIDVQRGFARRQERQAVTQRAVTSDRKPGKRFALYGIVVTGAW